MALVTRTITHTLFGQDGVELALAEVIAELSTDEEDLTAKHVRINESPLLQFTASAGGVALLALPDNVSNTFYTIKTYPAATTDFNNTTPLHAIKIRVAGSDADLVDIITGA